MTLSELFKGSFCRFGEYTRNVILPELVIKRSAAQAQSC